MYDITCVGILVADVIAKPVEGLPERGLLSLVDTLELYSGGNAMTASINCAKLGLKTAVIGKIGMDSFGGFLTKVLNENQVNCQGLKVDAQVQTSASVALIGKDGERSFLHCTGANAVFSIEDMDWELVKNSKMVFVTGTFLLDRFDGQQTRDFLRTCKELGKITALDVCWDSRGRWGTLLEEVYPYIDLFLPSIEEAEKLSGESEVAKMAEVFFLKGVKQVVIKCGKDGCYACEKPDEPGRFSLAYQNIKVVDTTGAGDSFCSGFLAAYARGQNFFDCARFANAVGAHCVMAGGATSGIKSYEEIIQFMEKHN